MGDVAKFIEELANNEAFAEKVIKVSNSDEIIAIAADAGIQVTAEDLAEAEKQLKMEVSRATEGEMEELTLDELENASGGAFFAGEDASDGHEMGCFIKWHKADDCKQLDEWCTFNYYDKETGESHYAHTVDEAAKRYNRNKKKNRQ